MLPRTFRQASPWLADTVVLALVAACLFYGLGGPPLRDNNEALYADIARAMSLGGSWIIPHLNGVPYIEKPPMLYWLMAASFKMFGFGAWQARLPDTVAAWLTAAGCMAYGRSMRAPMAGRFAALVCGTALGYVLIARTILFDPLLALGWLTAYALVARAVHDRDRRWLRLAMIPLALGMLTKGPEALLLLGLVGLVQLLLDPAPMRRAELLRFYLDPWAIALLLVLVAPWHVAATLEQPGFAWFFFVNETINRFLGTRIPADFHTGPWWYYGPKLLIGLFQWTPLLLVLAWRAPRADGGDAAAASARWARNAAAVLILFYSLASNKGAYYLLPTVVLIAWWGGVRLQRACEHGRLTLLIAPLGAAALAFGVGALALFTATFTGPVHAELLRVGLPASEFAVIPVLIGALALVAMLAGLALRGGRLHAGLFLYGLAGPVMMLFATRLDIAKTDDTSQQRVAAAMHAVLPANADVFSWQTFEDQDASLLVYGFPRLRIVDSTSADLWFGCRHVPAGDSPCVGPAAVRRARAEGRAFAVWVARDRLASFTASGLGNGLARLYFRDSVVFYALGAHDGGKNARTTP